MDRLATALLGPDMATRADEPFVAVQDEISHVVAHSSSNLVS
jgi:hypothetical protein